MSRLRLSNPHPASRTSHLVTRIPYPAPPLLKLVKNIEIAAVDLKDCGDDESGNDGENERRIDDGGNGHRRICFLLILAAAVNQVAVELAALNSGAVKSAEVGRKAFEPPELLARFVAVGKSRRHLFKSLIESFVIHNSAGQSPGAGSGHARRDKGAECVRKISQCLFLAVFFEQGDTTEQAWKEWMVALSQIPN